MPHLGHTDSSSPRTKPMSKGSAKPMSCPASRVRAKLGWPDPNAQAGGSGSLLDKMEEPLLFPETGSTAALENTGCFLREQGIVTQQTRLCAPSPTEHVPALGLSQRSWQGCLLQALCQPNPSRERPPSVPGAEQGRRAVRSTRRGSAHFPPGWAGAAGDRGALALRPDRLLRPPWPLPGRGGCVCSGCV